VLKTLGKIGLKPLRKNFREFAKTSGKIGKAGKKQTARSKFTREA
jgi:hypothetical protein